MLEKFPLDTLSKRLAEAIPVDLGRFGADIEKTFQGILQSSLAGLNLVSREEFEVQRAVLAKTRAKLEHLEARVAELEYKLPKP